MRLPDVFSGRRRLRPAPSIQTITPIDNIDSIPKDELDSALDAIKAKIKELENM